MYVGLTYTLSHLVRVFIVQKEVVVINTNINIYRK